MADNKKYYISQDGNQLGPWSIHEIVGKVKSQELKVVDYIFDESKEDWVSLLEFQDFQGLLKDFKPKTPPKPKAEEEPVKKDNMVNNNQSESSEWYVLKGENKFGPFSYTEVVKMLQQKLVFEFDFAWKPSMENWSRIAELNDFQYENVKSLKEKDMPDLEEVFFRRRHRRANYGGTIIVHDNKKVWKGQGVEISGGGAGIIMENAMIVPGQELFLHFKPGDGVPPFNARCEVVSKKYIDGVKEKDAPIRYGIKFIELNQETQEFLNVYTEDPSKAAA